MTALLIKAVLKIHLLKINLFFAADCFMKKEKKEIKYNFIFENPSKIYLEGLEDLLVDRDLPFVHPWFMKS